MNKVLNDRVAVITGAGRGIGRGIAQRFVEEGAKVVIAELREDIGRSVADELGENALFVHADASDKASVESMIERSIEAFGTIDILVNNAWGGGTLQRLENKSEDVMSHGINLGFSGPFWAMRAAFPYMREKQWGRIINVCSLNGINAHMGTVEYNAGKEALRAATRTAAREWAPHGITCNIICPAAKSHTFGASVGRNPEIEAAADAANPMGRIGDCYEDIAPVALFLASDGSRYMTGNTLFVDGGGHINGVTWAPALPD